MSTSHPVVATVEQWDQIKAAELILEATSRDLEVFVNDDAHVPLERECFSLTLKQVSALLAALLENEEARSRLFQCAIRSRSRHLSAVSISHSAEASRIAVPQTVRNLRKSKGARDAYREKSSRESLSLQGVSDLLEDMVAYSRYSEHLLCLEVSRIVQGGGKVADEVWCPESMELQEVPQSPQSP